MVEELERKRMKQELTANIRISGVDAGKEGEEVMGVYQYEAPPAGELDPHPTYHKGKLELVHDGTGWSVVSFPSASPTR